MDYKTGKMLAASVIFFIFLTTSRAAYDVGIQLIEYERDEDCSCDGGLWGCHECDVFFKVCCSSGANRTCVGGDENQRVDDKSQFRFSDSSSLPSSLHVILQNWNSFTLTVQIQDYDAFDGNDDLGTVSYTYTGKPANVSTVTTNRGNKNLSITFSITVFCKPADNFVCDPNGNMICKKDYYDTNCSTYCKNEGHKVCTANGIPQCQSQYYGPNCSIHCVPTNQNQLCLSSGTKVCKPTYYGPMCEKKCVELGNIECDNNGMEICRQGYTGHNCESIIDRCISSPCIHGTCVNKIDKFSCTCHSNFTGQNCDTNLKDCIHFPALCSTILKNTTNTIPTSISTMGKIESSKRQTTIHNLTTQLSPTHQPSSSYINACNSFPCQNNATCIDYGNHVTCICREEFAGSQCQHKLERCSPSLCLFNGTCINTAVGYSCNCRHGFIGKHCEIDIDECTWNLCPTGTACSNYVGGFKCVNGTRKSTICQRLLLTSHLRMKTANKGTYSVSFPLADEFQMTSMSSMISSLRILITEKICPNYSRTGVKPLELDINFSEQILTITSECRDRPVTYRLFQQAVRDLTKESLGYPDLRRVLRLIKIPA